MGMGKDCITDNELYIFFCFIGPSSVLAKLTLKVLAFQENCDPELVPRFAFCVSQTLEKPTCARNR